MKEKLLSFNDSILDEKAAQNWFKVLAAYFIVVHAWIFSFASFADLNILAYLNIGSIVLYGLSYLLITRNFLQLTFFVTLMENIFHSLAISMILADDLSCTLYLLILVPLSFFFLYLARVKHILAKSIFVSILATIAFITCKLVPFYTNPIYSISSEEKWVPVITIVNSVLVFLALVFFSSIFIVAVTKSKVFSDIKYQKLDEDAGIDQLTGLQNKRHLEKALDDIAEVSKKEDIPFCVCIFDLDNFKRINDDFGLTKGDKIIKDVADILKDCVSENDYLCRWTGQSYLILLRDFDLETAVNLSELIRMRIDEHEFELNGIDVHVTATAGIAQYRDGQRPKDLVDEADHLMRYGKSHGKNRVVTHLTLI